MEEYDYLLSGLRHAPQELVKILKEIPDELEDEPLKENEWSAHQIVFHLRDVNANVYIPRLNQIIEQTNPVFQEFDPEQWMETHYDPSEPMDELFRLTKVA
jgi:uncharacterized damage-inducible protein DinB